MSRRGFTIIELLVAMVLLMMVILLPRLWQGRKRKERYLETLARRRSRQVP